MKENIEEIVEPDRAGSRWRKRLGILALVIISIGISIGAFVMFRSTGSVAGRPVPAPPTVRFGSDDGAPLAGGGSLVLQPEQVANAGIKTEEVEEVPVDSTGSINGTGVLSADAYADVPVTAVGGGSVSEVYVDLGDNVRKGARLATVVSDEFARAESDFLASVAAEENAKRNLERAQRLLGLNQPGRTEYETALKDKVSADASLVEAKARFERSARLVEIGAVSREQHDQETARYKSAEAESSRAASRLQRAESVLSVSPEVKRDEEQAREAYLRSAGDRSAARAKLKMFGLTDSDVEELRRKNAPSGTLTVRAQNDGTVTVRNCIVGQLLQKDQEIFRITDLSRLWFIAQAFEQDAVKLRVGMTAEVSVGSEAQIRSGRVVLIEPKVNEATRTVQVRIELKNPDGKLRIGSLASAALLAGSVREKGVAVKRNAVQRIGRDDVVFIAGADERTYEMRPVRLGPESGGLIRILEGVKVGERVVVEGSFLLRAEWLKRNPM